MGKMEIIRQILANNPNAVVVDLKGAPLPTEDDLKGLPVILDESASVLYPEQAEKLRAAVEARLAEEEKLADFEGRMGLPVIGPDGKPDVIPPILWGAARDKAEQFAFDVDSLLDGKEDDGLADILVPVRDFLRQLSGVPSRPWSS